MKTLEEMKAELLEEVRQTIITKRENWFIKRIFIPFACSCVFVSVAGVIAAFILSNPVYFLVIVAAGIAYAAVSVCFNLTKNSFIRKRISDTELNNVYKEEIIKKKGNMLKRKAEIPEELVELEEDYKKDLAELKHSYNENCGELEQEFQDLCNDYETICKLNETI